jgi:hypothetical protein
LRGIIHESLTPLQAYDLYQTFEQDLQPTL